MISLQPRYLLLLLVAAALGLYYPTLFAPFNPLDDQLMVFNLLNQEEFKLRSVFMPGGVSSYFRPVLALTYQVDKYLWGLEESFMHLENMALHALNGCLVYLVGVRLTRFLKGENHLLPFGAALFFVVHPINTEAVNWISARADLLAGTFVLATLWLLFKALETRRLVFGLIAAGTFLLGALSKETALFLLPGIFLMFVWRRSVHEVPWRARWLIFCVFVCCVAGYFTLRSHAFQADLGRHHATAVLTTAVGGEISSSLPTLPENAPRDGNDASVLGLLHVSLKAAGFYAVKLFQPLPLNFAITRVADYYVVPGLVAAFATFFLVVRRRPLDVILLIGICTGSAALLVVFTGLAWTPVAERYMYIPCSLFALVLFIGTGRLLRTVPVRAVALPATALLLTVYGTASYARNLVWQDNLALYRDTLRKNPEFPLAKNQLAMLLLEAGQDQDAYELMAGNTVGQGQRATVNQAIAVMQRGDYDESRRMLEEKLKNPGLDEVLILEKLIGITYQHIGSIGADQRSVYYRDIAGWLRRIYGRHPGGFVAYRLGRVHLLLGERAEARQYFSDAARLLPETSLYSEPAKKLARNLEK